jgi:hypothetical protein
LAGEAVTLAVAVVGVRALAEVMRREAVVVVSCSRLLLVTRWPVLVMPTTVTLYCTNEVAVQLVA